MNTHEVAPTDSGYRQLSVDYWVRYLTGAPASVDIPTDRRRPARQQFAPARLDVLVPAPTVAALRDLAGRLQTIPDVVLMGAFHTLLYRISRQLTIVTATASVIESAGQESSRTPNVVVLRSDFTDDTTTIGLLKALDVSVRDAAMHASVPFQDVLEALALPHDASRAPLVQTFLAVSPAGTIGLASAGASEMPSPRCAAPLPFDLRIDLRERDDEFAGTIVYDATLFERATIERMAGHLSVLIHEMSADPARPLSAVRLLTAEERAALLAMLPPLRAFPSQMPLHEQFERQVARTPQAIALTAFDDRDARLDMTYAELNAHANAVAHRLRAAGVTAGHRVGLRTERNANLVIGLLAILKAGAAYVPLDPVYPIERAAFILEDANVSVLLTERNLAEAVDGVVTATLCVDEATRESLTSNLPATSSAADLAYVIYTSGSTGKPKGVGITHANVARLFTATEHWYGFNEKDVWTLFHSYAFDFSVWEFWGAFLYGGRLVVTPRDTARNPDAFHQLLQRECVTVLNQTPTAFRQLIDADQRQASTQLSLRYVVFGGEALELQSLKPWVARYGDRSPLLINMYGITETTVHVTYRPISLADIDANAGSMIGEPIPDLRVYVLDTNGDPAPIGVAGEMCVAGAGVADGYLNRPELTSQRFVRDPFAPDCDALMYRSGDLARRLANGDLEYLGRMDQQVKIRGFRIELGEIESVIARDAAVRQVAVIDREDVAGDKRLVAYIVSDESPADLIERLRTAVRAALPDYMVPAHFLVIEALPLTPNGKLDRKSLPSPLAAPQTTERAPGAPARGETEQAVRDVWKAVLGVDDFGANTSFFDLGGDSLTAMKVIARLRQNLGVEVRLRDFFRSPTVADLSAGIAARRAPVTGTSVSASQ